jgi:hypothetical protein
MKEKDKVKSHPFAGHLRTTEEVLWMTSDLHLPEQQTHASRYALWGMGLLLGLILISSSRPVNTQLSLLIACGGASMLIILFGLALWLVSRKWATEEAYAVTNERLLYRRQNKVIAVPLEAVTRIKVYTFQSSTGTLSVFGPYFPGWKHVEEVEHVKEIIEDAQKQRLKDLKA